MPKITIDGEAVTLQNTHQGIDTLITAAGLDWRRYDILRVDDGSQSGTTVYRAGQTLDVHDGDEFVTASISAPN